MGTTCVAYRVWSSNRIRLLLAQRGEAGADGEEDVSDDRSDRDLRALVCGSFPGPDCRQFGPGPQDGPQVLGPGYSGRFGPWWAAGDDRGAVAGPGRVVVPGGGREGSEAGHV